MRNKRIKERDIWVDMVRNPDEYINAYRYVFVSILCVVAIVVIRLVS